MTPALQVQPASRARSGVRAAACVIAALFLLVYARSLTFVYIEGDDATSIAYHALGRVRAIQPPYSAYQCGMDAILRILPAQEHVLRVTAMLLTAAAAPVLMLLVLLLAFEWGGDAIRISRPLAAVVIPLAAPELLYLGLVYTPALVGLAAAVGAHLLARRGRLWPSALLFGAGVACRWDILAYGAIIAADLWFGPGLDGTPRRLLRAVSWGVAALAAWVGAVALSGYGPATILKTIRTAGPVESYPGLTVAAATMQTLATPALLLFGALGFAVLAKRRNPAAILALLGLALTVRYVPLGVPKWFLIAVPGLVTCALAGFSAAWEGRAPVMRAVAIACLIGPWLIGIQTLAGDSAYGPGFQVRPFNRPLTSRSFVRPVLGAGALVPTSEGPRPVGGHAFVLLGGAWRTTVQAASDELTGAAQQAVARGLPILQDMGQGYVVSTLAGMGFTTQDSWKLDSRMFVSPGGGSVRVIRPRSREELFAPDGEQRVEELAGRRQVVAYAYTSTLRRLYKHTPDSLEAIGATAAVVDLDKLRGPADKMADGAPERLP